MDKLKNLVSMLKEVPAHAPSLKTETTSLVRRLGKIYESERAYENLQKPLNGFLLNAQSCQHKGVFPKNFFVRLYGCVVEFDEEYSKLRSEFQKVTKN